MLSKYFFSKTYLIKCIILILFWKILGSKEDSSINKRIYQKAFFRRNFSCKVAQSAVHLFPMQSTSQPGSFQDVSSSCIQEKPRSYSSYLPCSMIYIQVLSVSPLIHLSNQSISLHFHIYHPNARHFLKRYILLIS